MKKQKTFIEKVLLLLLLIGATSIGIKAQESITTPSAFIIRDGIKNGEYTIEDWIDIYSSSDVVGGKARQGYVYYITTNGIKLWEPPSSFRKHFWKTINEVADRQNWTRDGERFIPETRMSELSWEQIINDYCVIDYDSWKKDEIEVFGWQHNKEQDKSRIVSSKRDSRKNEGKLCFNTASFESVSAPLILIPIRSSGCGNPLRKEFPREKRVEIIREQQVYSTIVSPSPASCQCVQQTPFVYVSQRQQVVEQQPQIVQSSNTSSHFGFNLGLTLLNTASQLVGGYQGYQQPSYTPQVYYPPTSQPVWGNPNPILGNGYFDNGGPVQGGGGFPVGGGPAQGNGTFPVNGGPFQGNSGVNTGGPVSGNSGFNTGGPISGNSGVNTGGPISGNSGVSTGGPVQGGGGNPILGNGPR